MKKAHETDENEYGYVARSKKQLEILRCNECDKELCYVYECDLNGSYFYCDECYEKIPDYFFP